MLVSQKGLCSMELVLEKKRNTYRFLVGKFEGKRSF
jgi:hypothetical protein